MLWPDSSEDCLSLTLRLSALNAAETQPRVPRQFGLSPQNKKNVTTSTSVTFPKFSVMIL